MRNRRLLVTGAAGFIGGWILRHWSKARPEVELWATDRVPLAADTGAAYYRQCDLSDMGSVNRLVEACRPDQVIHLAGTTGAGSLSDHVQANLLASESLYRALGEIPSRTAVTILQPGSAAQYGRVESDELPVTEAQPMRPVSAYGISKTAQEHLARALSMQYGLQTIFVRMFNVVGPGQPEHLIPMEFIQKLKAILGGEAGPLRVGDMSPRRDFVDVRDVASAYDAVLARGIAGEVYNVASGRDLSVREVIEMLLHVAGATGTVKVETTTGRPLDVLHVRADISKIQSHTGWQPFISFRTSLEDTWAGAMQQPRVDNRRHRES